MHAWPPRLPTLQKPQPAAPAPLAQCLLLAALLHLWLVVLLGNAAGGTAEPGQGVWGAINVRLRGPVAEAPPAVPQPPVLPGGAPGQAAAERWGGAVRSPQVQAHEEPGAEKLGHWGPQPQPAPAAVGELTSAPILTPLELPALPAAPEALPATAPPVRLRDALPASPARVEALPPARAEPTAAPRAIAPALAAPLPAPQATPLRALPAAPPPRAAADQAPALPQPAALEPAAAALPEIALPQSQPAMPALAAEPELRPLQPAVPLATPLPAAPSALAPMAQPAATAPALSAVPAGPAAPAALPRVALPAAASEGGTAASLDAGARVGHDVATPASNAASVLPRLNLELARPRGGELARGAARGALPVLPRPPELDDKLARDIEKAAKADCRKAYAGAGLLAVVPLAADALGKSGGCKW